MKTKNIVLTIGLSAMTAIAAQAQQSGSITFQDGLENAFSNGQPYEGTRDTFIDSGNPGNTFGGSPIFKFNGDRYAALLYFDLNSFPEQVQSVTNAKLSLAVRGIPGWDGQTYTISVYQMNAANAGWMDSTLDAKPAAPGETAWNFKNKGAKGEPNILWASGASFSAADYSATPIATYDYTYTDASNTTGTYIDILIPDSMAMDWINNPSSNAGLVFRVEGLTGTSAIAFWSTDKGEFLPSLSFDYVLAIPEPSAYALLLLGAVGGLVWVRRSRSPRA